MRNGIVLFTSDRGIAPATLARAAEERGFDTVYVPEHTHIPVRRQAAHPSTGDASLPDDRYSRTLDPWVSLATAAAVTERIGLSTAVCLPGTHSKWATLAGSRVDAFSTAMTGEVFAALRGGTILGRMMRGDATDDDAFRRGVVRAGEPGGVLHHLFGVRSLGLFGQLSDTAAASYLSGLLIGHEIGAVAPVGPVQLVSAAELCRLYALALAERGIDSSQAPPDLAARGLAAIAEAAGWN